ncbi:MAG: glycosyl transferase, group 1 [uncultured bacterium]|nr:MAG: glycosyl transferase, group 1 [uncultured bacterium]
MRIGIDARLIKETGVGRYIRNLIDEVSIIDQTNTFIVFLTKDSFEQFQLPNNRWEKRLANVHWHTLKEQLVMPKLLSEALLDLVHIPYFNVPLFLKTPCIVTIHDLTVLHFQTGKATTLPYILYFLKWIGYYLILRIGLAKTKHIIAVSKTVCDDLQHSLGMPKNKITVTYEGVDKSIKYQVSSIKYENKFKILQPYIMYVGNAYPHKNVEVLIHAFDAFKKTPQGKDFHLVLIGSDTMFYKRLHVLVETLSSKDAIQFTGLISDELLIHAYTNAHCLVFPSLSEGFGLPALEALSLGCPVICSDIPIFHEILGNSATYFDPKSVDSLVSILCSVSNKREIPDINVLKRYSWKKMAAQTLAIYEYALSS